MKTTGLTESQLLDLISGRLQGSLQQLQHRLNASDPHPDLLPELGHEIAKVLAAAIHANNVTCAEQAERSQSDGRVSTTQYYDHLSECIDGY
jgi:hypothetical protein